jgi:hypothetical protein
MKKDF